MPEPLDLEQLRETCRTGTLGHGMSLQLINECERLRGEVASANKARVEAVKNYGDLIREHVDLMGDLFGDHNPEDSEMLLRQLKEKADGYDELKELEEFV